MQLLRNTERPCVTRGAAAKKRVIAAACWRQAFALPDPRMLVNRGLPGERQLMENRRSSFEYEDLLACGRKELFRDGPQLPLPPMLMFDRITEIAEAGGEYGKGLIRAVLNVKP